MEMLQFTYYLSVEPKSMWDEAPMNVDMIFFLDNEGTWIECRKRKHQNCCNITLEDA
jgi:hypothetical protein